MPHSKRSKIIRVFIFVGLVFIIDLVVGKGLKQIYFSTKSGVEYRTTYIIDSVKSECVILGSSRAAHHYIPTIIADSIQMSCYNAGIRARILYFQYEMLKCMLDRYTPKLVVLDSSPFEITFTGADKPDFTSLSPYYETNNSIRNSINQSDPLSRLKYLSHIYAYNSNMHLLFDRFNPDKTESINGFVPVAGVTKNKKREDIKLSGVVDDNKVKTLENFIALCRQKNVKLIVIQSPWFKEIKKDACYYKFENILKQQGVDYIDLSQMSEFDHYVYFKDYGHLNDKGAIIYSEIVASKLKQQLVL